jgi:L-fucose mutarotase/ribose pyranase (RbsD/FucU family)
MAETHAGAGATTLVPHLLQKRNPEDMSLDQAELKQIAETWGTQFADCLIADARWPSCNQAAAVVAAGAVVKSAIGGIARILDVGDFAPHTEMMSATMHNAFWDSMPNPGKKNRR